MKKIILVVTMPLFTFAGNYKVPPSHNTYGSGYQLDDSAMKECVRVYNQAENLQWELNNAVIDRSSSYAVSNYNAMVNELNDLINWYNINCANKSASGADSATRELNNGYYGY